MGYLLKNWMPNSNLDRLEFKEKGNSRQRIRHRDSNLDRLEFKVVPSGEAGSVDKFEFRQTGI